MDTENVAAPLDAAAPLTDLIKRFAALEDDVEQKKTALKQALEPLEAELLSLEAALVERFEAEEVQNLKLPEHGTFFLRTTTKAAVPVVSRDAFMAWLDARGLSELMPRTLNAQTFAKQYRDWEQNDQPLPPEDLVTVFRKKEIGRRKS